MLGIVAETLLTIGGYIGGSLVFVYGNRVLSKPDLSVREALTPVNENPEEEPT